MTTIIMQKGLITVSFILLALVLGHTQTSGQNFIGNQREINKILENTKKFSQYIVNADYDNIRDSYTVDGKIFPNRRDIIVGGDDIRKYWILPEGVKTIKHKVTPQEIKITGKEAFDYGYYEGKTRRADGEEISWRGKYVIIWRKVGGDWKIYLDIWNSIDE